MSRLTPKTILAILLCCSLQPAAGSMLEPSASDANDDGPERTVLPPQTAVYYNARIALREERYQDVLRLWLLRNALKQQDETPLHDDDFRSGLWVALAGAGLCHDGLAEDNGKNGAGLWPLALFNWLTRSSSRQPAPGQPRSFTSFDYGFQQRYFSLYDVLSYEELMSARFVRGTCFRPYIERMLLGQYRWLDLKDRLSYGIMMRDLLMRAQNTLRTDRVRGHIVLEARLFDLEVALARLAKSKIRRETGVLAQMARMTGVSATAMAFIREEKLQDLRRTEYAGLLRQSLTWTESDWFALSRNRRVALFTETVDSFSGDNRMEPLLYHTVLQNMDSVIRREDGDELNLWLGFASAKTMSVAASTDLQEEESAPKANPGQNVEWILGERLHRPLIADIALGSRGERLLGLDPSTGFRERAIIALWRGVDYLERGESMDAMRSFALAMKRAEESRQSDTVYRLSKRWFAYVLAQHKADAEALAILKEFVPALERNALLEVLLWRAAFYVDKDSFERIASLVRRGGAMDFRVRHLRELAKGDAGKMWAAVREELKDTPHAVYKFSKQLTEELATETFDVRANNRSTLELGMRVLSELEGEVNRGLQRRIGEQLERMQSLLDRMEIFDASIEGRARAATPGAEAYAGSVRLAPSDQLPWPFLYPQVQAPSPFSALKIVPIEWLNENGERVFGWQIKE
jgi:hypothetical protein